MGAAARRCRRRQGLDVLGCPARTAEWLLLPPARPPHAPSSPPGCDDSARRRELRAAAGTRPRRSSSCRCTSCWPRLRRAGHAGLRRSRLPASPEPPGNWSVAQRAGTRACRSRETWRAQRPAGRTPCSNPHVRPALARQRRQRRAGPAQPAGAGPAARPCPAALADPRRPRSPVLPTAAPTPSGALLPVENISASAYEDLRRCPYRFFALRQLGLQEAPTSSTSRSTSATSATGCTRCCAISTRAARRRPARRARGACSTGARSAPRAAGLADGEFLPFAAAWPAGARRLPGLAARPRGLRRGLRRRPRLEARSRWAACAWSAASTASTAGRRPPAGDRLQDRVLQVTKERVKAARGRHAAGLLRRAAGRRHLARRLRQRRREVVRHAEGRAARRGARRATRWSKASSTTSRASRRRAVAGAGRRARLRVLRRARPLPPGFWDAVK
jgi:hypothetical protein